MRVAIAMSASPPKYQDEEDVSSFLDNIDYPGMYETLESTNRHEVLVPVD
jgi:hypothetical protein